VLQSETVSSRKSLSVNGRYSFTAPGGINIPLFGKVRFRSTATIDLTIRKNSDFAETSANNGPYVTSSDRSDLTVTPVVSYQFSSQIKGGLTARWQDTTDKQRSRTSHIRELQIWVELRF
jgi:hypothetical protein